MATVIKRNSRKLSDVGPVFVAFGNYSLPRLASQKHIELNIGDTLIRIELDKAAEMANKILQHAEQHG